MSAAMIGNDMILDLSRPVAPRKYRNYSRHVYAFPKESSPKAKQELPVLPNLFKYMLEATPAIAPATTQPSVAQVNYVPSERLSKRPLHIKGIVVSATVLLALAGLTAAGFIYKKQVMGAVKDVRVALAKQPAAPKPNPRQIVIPNYDYNQALTALITQPVNVNVAGSSQAVNPSTIGNWLNIKKLNKVTDISVDSNQVTGYLNQLANSSNGSISAGRVTAAVDQIANNILKANGVTVSL